MAGDVVVGVDVGTTATKVVAYDPDDGRVVAEAEAGYPLHSPHAGWAEQDADEIVEAALDSLARVVDGSARGRIAAVGLGTAMHSLVGLDADHRCITPLLTYADTRAWPQALAVRREHGLALYRATGTPIHPMAPLAKLRWIAEEQPDVARRVRRWVSIKEVLVQRLCDSDVVDHAVASASGLLDLGTLTWHEDALRVAGVDADQLGTPADTRTVLDGVRPDVAERLGLATDTPIVLGAGDGVLANLGVGAVRPGIGALTIGTSGAVRVTAPTPRTDPDMRTFCYALTPEHWVLGGAISNGGLVLRWLDDNLLHGGSYDELTAEAASVAPGSDGVLVLPYLTGERAPRWSPLRGAVVFGMRVEHRRAHVIRAAMESVALQLRLVTDALAEADADADRLRVTGGFVASDLWLQIVADVLGTDLEGPATDEAAAYGAALLAMDALDMVDDLDAAAGRVGVARTVTADPDAVARYDDVAARHAELIDHVEPLLREASITAVPSRAQRRAGTPSDGSRSREGTS